MKNKHKEIGQRIRELRKSRNLTQKELASLLGVGASTVHRWEQGNVSHIRTSMIQKLADCLGASPIDFINIK